MSKLEANFRNMGPDAPRNPTHTSLFPATTGDGSARTLLNADVTTARPGVGMSERFPIARQPISRELSSNRCFDVNRKGFPRAL